MVSTISIPTNSMVQPNQDIAAHDPNPDRNEDEISAGLSYEDAVSSDDDGDVECDINPLPFGITYNREEFSDAVIIVGEERRKIYVSRAILAARSQFFFKLIQWRYQQHTESKLNDEKPVVEVEFDAKGRLVIQMQEYDYAILDILLQYAYTDTVTLGAILPEQLIQIMIVADELLFTEFITSLNPSSFTKMSNDEVLRALAEADRRGVSKQIEEYAFGGSAELWNRLGHEYLLQVYFLHAPYGTVYGSNIDFAVCM